MSKQPRRVKTHRLPSKAKARRSTALTGPAAKQEAPPTRSRQTSGSADLTQLASARTLFWQNVVRQILTDLSGLRERQPEVFDGRIAVLTRGGERIPIADVDPMFACGLVGTGGDVRAANLAVECTVFRIRTPSGEVFTLPLEEIRAVHTLSPELIKELEQQALAELSAAGEPADDGSDPERPFGLAAFRSLVPPAPLHGLYTESAE